MRPSSPSVSRIAVTEAWNEPLVGAHPIRSFHSGLGEALRIESGSSLAETASVL